MKPARGALVAGVDDKGPAKPAGIKAGDVVLEFDGKDVKDAKDLPRWWPTPPVGKEVDVVIIRKGAEVTSKVTLGRLEDRDKAQQASAKTKDEPTEKPVTQKALGLDLGDAEQGLRTKYKIKDSVKGVIVTGVDGTSDAAEKRLSAGDVIVEVAQEAVDERCRHQEARRSAQEGRQEVDPAAGRQRRGRTALRGAARAVGRRHAELTRRPSLREAMRCPRSSAGYGVDACERLTSTNSSRRYPCGYSSAVRSPWSIRAAAAAATAGLA